MTTQEKSNQPSGPEPGETLLDFGRRVLKTQPFSVMMGVHLRRWEKGIAETELGEMVAPSRHGSGEDLEGLERLA